MKGAFITLLSIGIALAATAGDLGNRAPRKSSSTPTAHPPNNPEAIRQGGDTVADAFAIPEIPFETNGTTTGYNDDYDEVCPYLGSTAPDVVYSLSTPADILVDIDMLGSEYDTKIYVYDAELNLIACNDDFYPDYVSKLENVPLLGGAQYFILIDGWGGEHGEYVMAIVEYVPCVLECPPGGLSEGEPPLVDDYEDAYNGGCNSPNYDNPFQELYGDENGDLTFCGVSGWYQYQGDGHRDTDWIILHVGNAGVVEAIGDAEQSTYLFDLGPQFCESGAINQVIQVGECAPGLMIMQSQPGATIWFWAGPTTFSAPDGSHPYEYDYVIWFSGLAPNPVHTESHSWTELKSLFR